MVRLGKFVLGLVVIPTTIVALVLTAFVMASYAYEGLLDHRLLGEVNMHTLIGWQPVTTEHPNLRIINASDEEKEDLIDAYENVKYPLGAFRITVGLSDNLTQAEGLFDVPTRRIYIRRGADYNYTLAHELGHLLDVEALSPSKQREYVALRRILFGDDWEGSYLRSQTWETKPSEDFAEVFAHLFSRSLNPPQVRTSVGPITNSDEIRDFYVRLLQPQAIH